MTSDINELKEVTNTIETLQVQMETELAEFVVVSSIAKEATHRSVLVSNYYIGDGSSGTTTASGLSTIDFEVNNDGFYTYDGMVVVATGSNRLDGLKAGFIAHELYEKLLLEINGVTYQSIVLDVCGACTWGVTGETLQRIDVFTVGNVIGKVEGTIYEYKNQ